MTPDLDRAALRRVATSHTDTKGFHHGTHNFNRSNSRTQDPGLPSLACHQQATTVSGPRLEPHGPTATARGCRSSSRSSRSAARSSCANRSPGSEGQSGRVKRAPNPVASLRWGVHRQSEAMSSRPELLHQIPIKMWERLWDKISKNRILLCKNNKIKRLTGDPYGNRTRVSAVKGPRPNR